MADRLHLIRERAEDPRTRTDRATLIEARASVADWYARVQARPSFETAVTQQLPQPIIDLFRNNGKAVWSDVEPLTRSH